MAAPAPAGAYATAHNNPPPPPLSMAGGPPQQGPSVLQILAMGQERNHAADAMAHHPRIESLVKLGKEAEATWLQIGQTAEAVGDLDRAIAAYEAALRHNAYSVGALSQIAAICRSKEDFKKAAEYFGRVVGISPENGDVWGALGHCYLMIDDLKKAYSSYQQALYYMPNPHEPKLWYGIGILYDRYGSLEHAEEAFSSVIRMDPNFEKSNEIFFRLGIIYKQQRKSTQSLECFRYILNNPPRPLTEIDIWFQIGHVYEQQKDFIAAKESYERVLQENPAHAKVLQQLGGLYHRSRAPFYNPEVSVQILTKSLESDPNDPFSWYLLGRAYMTTNNFGKAYEAYQQAVYRDGKNPAFWCSIGVLYYNINQFHDALDAYSRAIRIHPYLAEVWFNLGALYEACNDQMTDAIDAYQRTLQLDPSNTTVSHRLREIREHQTSGAVLSPPPPPKDISPSSLSWNYATNSGGAPTQLAQAGLGLELSPTMPTAAGGTAVAAVRAGGVGPNSPLTAHRFDGPPGTAGSRPRSTDPYRRASGARHSPSTSTDQSPRVAPPPGSAGGHRLSGGMSGILPQIKPMHDSRPSSAVRAGSPPSPRTRTAGEGALHPPAHPGYSLPSHLAQHHPFPPPSHEAMDWERSGRQGGVVAAQRSRHPHSPPPPSAIAHSIHSTHPAHLFDRSALPMGAGAHMQHPSRPPFFDNPPPGPYGGYPPSGSANSAAGFSATTAEENARRRNSGSTAASHRSSVTGPNAVDHKPLEPPAPAPVSAAKPRGRKKDNTDGDGHVKEPKPRKSRATANADGEGPAPKKPRKSKAAVEKEKAAAAAAQAQTQAQAQAQAQAQEKDAAAKAAAVLNGVANAARLASSPTQAPTPSVAAPPPALPQRDVDEDYDEGVDALMNLASAATPSAPPPPPPAPTASTVSTIPDPPAPLPHPAASLAAPLPQPPAAANGGVSPNPRKRSLPLDEAIAATPQPQVPSNAGEPDLKRSRSEHPAEPISAPVNGNNGHGGEQKQNCVVTPANGHVATVEEAKVESVPPPAAPAEQEEKEEGEVAA
ncbi:hypothetical protein JCM11641_006786 [Rhodosporidiobolus odoratus]